MAYNTMNQAHGRRDGINWATVALYGGGAAVGVGAAKAAYGAGKNTWNSKDMGGKLRRIAGLPSGGMAGANRAGYTQAGADFLYDRGLRSNLSTRDLKSRTRDARTAHARAIKSQRRIGGSASGLSGRLSRGLAGPAQAMVEGTRGRLDEAVKGAHTSEMQKGWRGAASSATGWLGAFDYAGQNWKRAGVAGARAGMVGLAAKGAYEGLGWLFG